MSMNGPHSAPVLQIYVIIKLELIYCKYSPGVGKKWKIEDVEN